MSERRDYYTGKARAKKPAPGTSATTRLRKVECPACGYTVRVTRKWLTVGLPVCPCGHGMTCPDASDLEIAQWREREAKQLANRKDAKSGGVSHWHSCHGCKRRLLHPDELCACGFQNDRRGAGRWVEVMPF